jgi:Clathrin light chain
MSMGFESDSGMRGFQPANVAGQWGAFGGPAGGSPGFNHEDQEDFLDDEERERVERVIAQTEERKRDLFARQDREDEERRTRKAKGREDLVKWSQ